MSHLQSHHRSCGVNKNVSSDIPCKPHDVFCPVSQGQYACQSYDAQIVLSVHVPRGMFAYMHIQKIPGANVLQIQVLVAINFTTRPRSCDSLHTKPCAHGTFVMTVAYLLKMQRRKAGMMSSGILAAHGQIPVSQSTGAAAPRLPIYQGTVKAGKKVIIVGINFWVAWDPPACVKAKDQWIGTAGMKQR